MSVVKILIMNTLKLANLKSKRTNALVRDEPNFLIVNSEPKFAILPMDYYESIMEALEDYNDILVANMRKEEGTISLEELLEEDV